MSLRKQIGVFLFISAGLILLMIYLLQKAKRLSEILAIIFTSLIIVIVDSCLIWLAFNAI